MNSSDSAALGRKSRASRADVRRREKRYTLIPRNTVFTTPMNSSEVASSTR
jgi:hypothetical protein